MPSREATGKCSATAASRGGFAERQFSRAFLSFKLLIQVRYSNGKDLYSPVKPAGFS